MNTNQIDALMTVVKANHIDWNVILPVIIAFLGTVVGAVMTFKMAQLTVIAKEGIKHAEETKIVAAATSVEVTDVLKKVNGGHEKMVIEIQTLNNRLNEMTAREAAATATATARQNPPGNIITNLMA